MERAPSAGAVGVLLGGGAVRDAHDFRLLGEFPSYGRAPHDCMLVDGGATLLVSNGGGAHGQADPPCVAWVDVATQQLRERCVLADEVVNAGHLAATADGDVAVVSAPRDGLAPTIGETLSVAIHEPTGIVGATTPLGNLVTFWRLDDGSLVHKLRVPMPRGIALSLSGEEFVINFGTHRAPPGSTRAPCSPAWPPPIAAAISRGRPAPTSRCCPAAELELTHGGGTLRR